MAYGTRGTFGAVREIDFTSISGVYVPVGTPFGEHVRIICLSNSCDQELYVSFDNVKNNLRMAKNSFKLFDFSANKIRDDGLFLSVSTQVYVKEVSASVSSGAFWVEIVYAEGGI